MERERNSNLRRYVIDIHASVERSRRHNYSHGNRDQFQRIGSGDERIRWSSHVRRSGEHDSPGYFRHAASRGYAYSVDRNMDEQPDLLHLSMERERDRNLGRHDFGIHACVERSWGLNDRHRNGDQFQRIDTGYKRFRWSGSRGLGNNICPSSPLLPVAHGKR